MGQLMTIDNWNQGYSNMMQPWQQSVWANSADAAQKQADDNEKYRKWYTDQSATNIALWQSAMIAVKTAIDLSLASIQDKRMRDLAADQRDIANRQLRMAEESHSRLVAGYWPVEDLYKNFAVEDFKQNRYVPQYNLQQGRARLDAIRAFSGSKARLNRKLTRYCTGANAEMMRLQDLEMARSEVQAVNNAYRYEELQMWRRDDLQLNRLQSAIANGQRLPAQASADMAAGAAGAAAANAMLGRASGGWLAAIGSEVGNAFQWGYSQLETSRLQSMGLGTPMRVGYGSTQSSYPSTWNQDGGFNAYTDAPYSIQNGGDGFLEGPVITPMGDM